MPRQYRKASYRLLHLKQTEKTLANAGEYARAIATREEAEQLVVVEQDVAQQKPVNDYRRGRATALANPD
jgi:hypothetical protein